MTDGNPHIYQPSDHPQSPRGYTYFSNYQPDSYEQSRNGVPGLPSSQYQSANEGLYTVSKQNNYFNSSGVPSGQRVRTQTNTYASSQVKNEEVVKGQSRINYVPYEKKVIEYENKQIVEKVPIKKKKTRMEERRVMETVPREVTKTEYMAVEKIIEYKKEIIPEKKIQMVSVQKKVKRYQYVPVEKQIVHYPENVDLETAKSQSRVVLQDQGFNIQGDAEFKPINPALIYNYSARPESRFNNIGYVDQGQSRVLSTAPTYQTYGYVPPSDSNGQVHAPGSTFATSQAYMPETTTYKSGTSNKFSPFQNIAGERRQTTQDSPEVVKNDPNGGERDDLGYRARGSYITELSSMANKQEASQPFDHITKSRNRPGITQVKRSSGNKFVDYGQKEVIQERTSNQNYPYEGSGQEQDWRVQP